MMTAQQIDELRRRRKLPPINPMSPQGVYAPSNELINTDVQPRELAPLEAPQDNPIMPPLEGIDKARDDYAKKIAEPAHKQNWGTQALFLGLQGLQKAFDPSNNQPIELLGNAKKRMRDQQAGQILAPLEAMNTRQRADRNQDVQWGNTNEDNARMRDDLVRKKDKDKATIEYWNRKADQADWKLASDDDLRGLRDKWMTSKDVNDKKRLELVEKEMGNRNDRAAAANKSRETIATGRNEAGIKRAELSVAERSQIAKNRFTQMDGKSKDDAINKAVDRWMQNNKEATPEEIAEIRRQLKATYQ